MDPGTNTILEQDDSAENEISVPRLRPSLSTRQKLCNPPRPDITSSTASKSYNQRSPSKARRKSIDGRPLIRSTTTKISVRMKPRPVPVPVPVPAPTPTTHSGAPSSASPSSRRGQSRNVSSSHLRKASWPSSPIGENGGSGLSGCDNPASSRAAGALRPRYSVSYRLARAPRTAATAAVAIAAPTAAESPAAEPSVETPAEADAGQTDAAATKESMGTETAADDESAARTEREARPSSSSSPPPTQPTPLFDEATRLAAAWREVQRRERQLKVREDALKLGQKRLGQDREVFEREKRRFQEELKVQQEQQHQQQKTRTATAAAAAAVHDEDNARKRRAARRGRSRSKPRSKVVLPDDSWRRDHHKQDHRHSSWSSVNSSDAGTNASRHSSTSYPSDADSVTTATTRASSSSTSSSSSSSSPCSLPKPQSEAQPKLKPAPAPAPAPQRTWSPTDLGPSLAAYNARWTALSPRSAHIPYPSPNHSAAELVDAKHLRSLLHLLLPLPHAAMEERRRMLAAIVANSSGSNHHDAVVQYNVVHFFLVARGVACRPVLSGSAAGAAVLKPDYGFGLRRVPVDGGKAEVSLRSLVREVRGELRRWHEDGLKYRSGGVNGDDENGHHHAERKINEELVKDETAKAVFRAFTELRDELLAEVRWRKDIAAADSVAAEARREKCARPGYGGGPGDDKSGGGVDWSVLSEAML